MGGEQSAASALRRCFALRCRFAPAHAAVSLWLWPDSRLTATPFVSEHADFCCALGDPGSTHRDDGGGRHDGWLRHHDCATDRLLHASGAAATHTACSVAATHQACSVQCFCWTPLTAASNCLCLSLLHTPQLLLLQLLTLLCAARQSGPASAAPCTARPWLHTPGSGTPCPAEAPHTGHVTHFFVQLL